MGCEYVSLATRRLPHQCQRSGEAASGPCRACTFAAGCMRCWNVMLEHRPGCCCCCCWDWAAESTFHLLGLRPSSAATSTHVASGPARSPRPLPSLVMLAVPASRRLDQGLAAVMIVGAGRAAIAWMDNRTRSSISSWAAQIPPSKGMASMPSSRAAWRGSSEPPSDRCAACPRGWRAAGHDSDRPAGPRQAGD